jgi:4-diphosphocytidyl-2-C-methyl-D-erythritol kinase
MLVLHAPAKINWFIKVLLLRSDGYHEIKSLIQKISLYDTISLKPSKELTIISDLNIPDEQNIVYRTAITLKKELGIHYGAEIRVLKNIPVYAGLGGGSSDAASTLLGLNKIWSLRLSQEELCTLAERLGSDVPFFLNGPFALVEGRGEKLTAFKPPEPLNILLVKPDVSVSTRWAYSSLSSARNADITSKLTKTSSKADNIKFLINKIQKTQFDFAGNVINDLESVTVERFPVIAEIKEKLLGEGAAFSSMSGSGATIFGVFDSVKSAENASGIFRDCWTAVVQTLNE